MGKVTACTSFGIACSMRSNKCSKLFGSPFCLLNFVGNPQWAPSFSIVVFTWCRKAWPVPLPDSAIFCEFVAYVFPENLLRKGELW